ncbi:YARHG domain-containing protein [Calothrix sp. FACHB-1219]|uniref:YARHG domain-containing protein n=1 Tax=unclassified Calothrix TaxID=2619626 RepID=UPI001683CDAF|nr:MULTISPECIES: YARHG domain-containing protein [unclassified Calothrix]MBD2207565.1 YARHG domain-containing protein [Calothrix sp. FACHB-168]MBD2222166.1 YARHG domain-containing protein [Calothrix sp. FACHB-1219]
MNKLLLSCLLLPFTPIAANANVIEAATSSTYLEHPKLIAANTENQPTREPRVNENGMITFDDTSYFYDYSWLSQRRVKESELSSYSPLFLDLLRNAIFARHGRKFVTPALQNYFGSQPWYSARYQPQQFPVNLLTQIEQHNVDTILRYQQKTGKIYFGNSSAVARRNPNTLPTTIKPKPATPKQPSAANSVTNQNWKNAQLIHTISSNNPVLSIVFNPDRKTLVTSGNGIQIWNLETGEKLRSLADKNLVNSIALSPDGNTLAAGITTDQHNNTMIEVWDLEMNESLYRISGAGNRVVITPDGQTLATGLSSQSTVQLWNLRTGEPKQKLSGKLEFYATSMSITGDGSILAARGFFNKLDLWDINPGKLIRTIEFSGSYGDTDVVALSPDGQFMVTTRGPISTGGVETAGVAVQIWNVRTGELIRALEGHSRLVASVAISPDSQYLASGSLDGTIRIFNLHTRELIRVLKDIGETISMSFSPDNRTLASGSSDGKIRIWQVP